MKKLSKKRIKENMKHKEKDEKKIDKYGSIIKIKSIWKEKSIKVIVFQNQKIIDCNSWFLLIYFF